jgi:hypothetical protein
MATTVVAPPTAIASPDRPSTDDAQLPTSTSPPDLAEKGRGPSLAVRGRFGPNVVSERLAAERHLLDRARKLLARRNSAGALRELQRHRREFPAGALRQEREAMTVNAMVLSGDFASARRRARSFHASYPGSFFGPTVDAALAAIPEAAGPSPGSR